MIAVKVLFETVDDRERIVMLIIRVWNAMHCALNNLRKLVAAEIDATGTILTFVLFTLEKKNFINCPSIPIEDPQIIFRQNSFVTKATEQYMRNIGTEYIKQILTQPVKAVFASKYSCEVSFSFLFFFSLSLFLSSQTSSILQL